MDKDKNREFIFRSESLVKPEDVTTISFLGDFNKLLPKKTQHSIMEKGSKSIPYMGFIVEPYCLFLAYKIKDIEVAQAMLPAGYELVDTAIFKNEPKCPMVIFSAFSVRTSAFIGRRLELYIIARNKDTGLLSWIIADYETNTNSHDPKNGFCGYTSDPAVLTTTPYGELLIDFKARKRNREFAVQTDLNKGKLKELDQDLWVEGNLSVDYGGEFADESSKPFSLIFDPVLMKEALEIPIESIEILQNSYLSDIIDFDNPVSAVVFPYSQHFIIKQDLKSSEVMNETDLEDQIKTFLSRSGYKTMKGDDIKKPLYRSIVISSILTFGFIVFLLIKLFT